jgi:hypothetical protein
VTGQAKSKRLRAGDAHNTPEMIQLRKRLSAAVDQAQAEMARLFGPITAANEGSAVSWREKRIEELMK